MVKYILVLSLCLIGCQVNTNAAIKNNAKAIVVAALTHSVLKKVDNPTPNIITGCDGSGWITHGDGNKTKCPGCQKCQNVGEVKKCHCPECSCSVCTCEKDKACSCDNCYTSKPSLDIQRVQVEHNIEVARASGHVVPDYKNPCKCQGGNCEDCKCTNQQECTLNVKVLNSGNLQVCNSHGCRIYLSYTNARNKVMSTRQQLLVACEVDKKEYLKLAAQARKEGKLFCIKEKADKNISQGVHTFNAP